MPVLVRDVLPTPEHGEKAPTPSVKRFFSPPTAAFLVRYSHALETTRYKRAELESAATLRCPLR
jgi:hypothetical protein